MTREEQLVFCKKCSNKRLDLKQGLICGITNQKADFEEQCPNFEMDEKVKKEIEDKKALIRPNKKRAEVAIKLIYIVMALDMLSIISSYLQFTLLEAIQNNEDVSEQMITFNDLREQIIGLLYTVLIIISSITFIRWFRRAYYNLHHRTECRYSEGWAAGGWFVPIASLFIPYQIMKEMWVKTSKLISEATDSISDTKGTALIGIWWTLWIISNYVGQYIIKVAFNSTSVEDYINLTIADIFDSLLGIPLALIVIKIIKRYAAKEEKLAEIENPEGNIEQHLVGTYKF